MRRDQLPRQRVQRVEPGGILAPAGLVVWGIHGGGDFVTGLRLGEALFTREPGESTDALRARAMREAMRDGKAVGYFVYDGLPPEHCRPTSGEPR